MPTLSDLEQGIYGTLTIERVGEPRTFEHARLQFSHAQGGKLEVPMDVVHSSGLSHVAFRNDSVHLFIPNASYRSAVHEGGNTRNEFVFENMLMGHGQNPRHLPFNRVEFSIDHLLNYFHVNPTEHLTKANNQQEIRVFSEQLVSETVPGWNATMSVLAIGSVQPQPNFGYDVRPKFNIQLVFEDDQLFDDVGSKMYKLSTFWEFMTQRPITPNTIHHIHRSSPGNRQTLLGKTIASYSYEVHWLSAQCQFHWGLCSKYVGQLFQRWIVLEADSPWMENCVRLVNHGNLPADVRFIMAYTALQGFGQELGLAGPLSDRKGTEEKRFWKNFERYWVCVLGPDEVQSQEYVNRLVRTRHHFAHLSKAGEDILRNSNEYHVAYLYLRTVLKALFLEAAGVSASEWQGLLKQWAMNIRSYEWGRGLNNAPS